MPRNTNQKRVDSLKKNEEKRPYGPQKKDKEYVVRKPQGLLEFLLENIKGQSRNNIKKLLSHKCIMVDGAAVSQFDFQLAKGDVVSISSVPMRKGQKKALALPNNVKLDIIYEDDEIIAINKPSGLLSVATDKEKDKTAYRMLMDYVRINNPRNRVYVVHRIDKDTSGVLIVTKNEKLKQLLQDSWNDIVTKRGYIAICDGIFKQKEGTVQSYLKETSTNVMYSSDNPHNGQLATTHYKVKKENAKYSMVDVNIDSGRKNQIRVHMGDLGHNIVGDTKYGDPSNPLKRLGLHAYALEFKHPVTGNMIKLKAPIPKEFISLINRK